MADVVNAVDDHTILQTGLDGGDAGTPMTLVHVCQIRTKDKPNPCVPAQQQTAVGHRAQHPLGATCRGAGGGRAGAVSHCLSGQGSNIHNKKCSSWTHLRPLREGVKRLFLQQLGDGWCPDILQVINLPRQDRS